MSIAAISGTRSVPLRRALLLTYITLVWMTLEGAVSLWLGTRSHSLLLDGFGLDSVVELASAGVLLWRLRVESGGTADVARVERAEHRASQFCGLCLYGLAAFVVLSSLYGLWVHRMTDTQESAWGILIGLTAKIGMPILAGFKLKVAAQLGSRALRADAMEAVTCGYLSVVLVTGLAATRLWGWWGLDSVLALVLVPFLLKEGREAWTGQCCCGTDCNAH